MKAKEPLIYISEFLISLSFTILASFYPGIAEQKGIPIWIIGLVFSADPLLGLPVSLWTGKNMTKFGRKNLLVLGLFLNGCATLLIGMLDFTEKTNAILLSFASRILAGIGAGLSMTTSSAILVIEYPSEIDRVIGLFEAASGLGLLLGPIVGSVLSMYKISVTFSALAGFFLGFSLFVQKFLTHSQGAQENHSTLPIKRLLNKPKLLIDFAAQMWLMLSLGYLSTVIELHLRSYGLSESLVGLVYSICLLVYFLASVLENTLLRCFSGKALTFLGIFSTSLGFLFVGDSFPGVPKSILVVSIGLGLVGLGGALMYSKKYIVPTTSNILYNSINLYKLENNDQLIDCISSCTIFISNFGEIIGPVVAGLLTQYFGYSFGFVVMAVSTFMFFVVYFFGAIRIKKGLAGPSKLDYLMIEKQRV